MQPYNIAAFPIDLDKWLKERFLIPILNIEGGWEYWLQIDFPAWLDISNDKQYDFRREVSEVVAGRLDWLLNSQTTGGLLTACELKAQTHKYLTRTFVKDVLVDVEKLSVLGTNYTKIVLAAVIDESARKILVRDYGFVPIVEYEDLFSILMHQAI